MLVKALLERGEREVAYRERLYLLAAAGVDGAPEIEPELRAVVARNLAELVPPKTITAAIALASGGELAVPLLGLTPALLAREASSSVRALGLIGSDAALEQLATYGRDSRITVIRELVRAWRNYDARQYAWRVMSQSPLRGGELAVRRGDDLSYLPPLQKLQSLEIQRVQTELDLVSLAQCTRLQRLWIRQPVGLVDLAALLPKPQLHVLSLFQPFDIQSLRGLESMPLRTLALIGATQLSSLDAVRRAEPTLQSLRISGAPVTDLEPLVAQSDLRMLELELREIDSLEPLSSLENLEVVRLGSVGHSLDLSWLALLPQAQ